MNETIINIEYYHSHEHKKVSYVAPGQKEPAAAV